MDARVRKDSRAEKPLLTILVKRVAIFLLLISAVTLFYWVVGSETSFLDETQSMLLEVMRQSSLGVLVASGFGILLAIVFAIIRRRFPRIMGIVGYILSAAFGAVALAIAQSVLELSRGLY
jgi:hypothetical protein